MTTQHQIPSDIAEIIKAKVLEIHAAQQQKEAAERQEREQLEAKGRAAVENYIQAALEKVPEFLRPYHTAFGEPPDFYRIGRGQSLASIRLFFAVPGLAMVAFDPADNTWMNQVARPGEQSYDYDGGRYDEEPFLIFQGDWNHDLAYVLARAQKQQKLFDQYQAEWSAKQAERAQAAEERAARNAEAEAAEQAELETRQRRERSEEEILFDVLRNDAVALWLVKAFLLINEERFSFEQRLEAADQSLYSMETHWSRRAEELRRQADDAERRAESERYDLQSRLDDMEDELKKAKRATSW